jgi:hypothetical protein
MTVIRVDRKCFVQRHYEIWARLFPRTNCRNLSPEQKKEIREQIHREFRLTPEEAQLVRQHLLASPDTASLILPFVEATPTVETLMVAANAIAAG